MSLNEPVLLLSLLALVSFFVLGLVGIGAAIVFNALFVAIVAFGVAGDLTVRDGLYWFSLANGLSSVLMLVLLSRSLRVERSTILYLCASLPATLLFTLLLPRIDTRALEIGLSIAVTAAGGLLLYTRGHRVLTSRARDLVAFPAGALAGTLSGLFGMGGPATILYLSRTNDDPSVFRGRAVLIGSASGILRAGVLFGQQAYGPQGLGWFVGTVPAILLGMGFGFWAHRFVQPGPLRFGLAGLVCAAGLSALLQTLRR